jgi:hypothetical protein
VGPLTVSCTDFRKAFNAWRDGKSVNHGLAEAMRVRAFSTRKVKHGGDDRPTGVYFGIGLKDVTLEEAKEAQPLVEEVPEEEALDEVPREVEPEDLAVVLRGADFGEFDGFRVRRSNDSPPLVSIIDLIRSTTGAANPRSAWADIKSRALEVAEFQLGSHQFPGEGQNQTPVTDAVGLVIILNLLPGQRAARFRVSCARIVVRYPKGGDETLVAEIRRNKGLMETMQVSADLQIVDGCQVPGDEGDVATAFNGIFARPVSKKVDGLVYTVTSPLSNAVKIGMWRGLKKKLRTRCATYYGPKLDLQCFASEDCRKLEVAVYKALVKFRIAGELFEKDRREIYPDIIEGCMNRLV